MLAAEDRFAALPLLLLCCVEWADQRWI